MLSATNPIRTRRFSAAEREIDWLRSILKNVAANVRRLLDDRNLSQTDLADGIGVTTPVVSRWLNAKSQIEMKNIDAIAEFLKVSYEELVQEPGTPAPKAFVQDVDHILRELARARGFELVPKKGKS